MIRFLPPRFFDQRIQNTFFSEILKSFFAIFFAEFLTFFPKNGVVCVNTNPYAIHNNGCNNDGGSGDHQCEFIYNIYYI